MKMLVKSVAGAVIAAAFASAGAASLLIDDFELPASGGTVTDTTTTTAGIAFRHAGLGMIGGSRDLFVEKLLPANPCTGTAGCSGGATFGVQDGFLDFSSAASVTGRAGVRWDGGAETVAGSGSGTVLDTSLAAWQAGREYSLAPFIGNLFDYGTAFALDVQVSDKPFQFSMTLFNDVDTYTTVTLTATVVNSPTIIPIPFLAFLAPAGEVPNGLISQGSDGGWNPFLGVSAIEVIVNDSKSYTNAPGLAANFQFQVGFVNSVPEPGSLALIGLGLLAAGAARRKTIKQ